MSDEPSTIESEVQYEIGPTRAMVSAEVAVHREIGDSEFDYVLVGSNPDETGSDQVAFGFHEGEIPQLPRPAEED